MPSSPLIFGGTFDPPHLAHLILPMLAKEAVNAGAVWYVPAGVSPFKTARKSSAASHRVAMLRLALADVPWARVLTQEVDRAVLSSGKPTFTVDTLEDLHREKPKQP